MTDVKTKLHVTISQNENYFFSNITGFIQVKRVFCYFFPQ